MRSILFTAAAIALATCPAFASQPVNDGSTMARASQGEQVETLGTATGEKVICRRDKEIGSRVNARRVCMTGSQWAAKAAEERRFVEQRQAQRTISGN